MVDSITGNVSFLDENNSGKAQREDDISNGNGSKKKTEKTFDGAKDARSTKGAGKYPNQQVIKTRSGHTISYDDSKDVENMTIQHRSGTGIQFHPNGAIQMTAHNGKYDIVFGENRMTITGANDISVKGDGSLRIFGDYRKTVHGNIEYSATESMVFRGKNIVHTASENYSTIAQTTTMKSSDAVQVSANKHASFVADNTVIAGRKKMFAGGTELAMEGSSAVSIKSSEGSMQVASASDFTHSVGGSSKVSVAQNFEESIGQKSITNVSQDRHLKVGGNNIQKVAGDSSLDVDGTKIIYAQTALHLNGPQGSQPNQPQQLSLFDVASNTHTPGTGQDPTDGSNLA